MKKFMEPELNVLKFAIEDIITTSPTDGAEETTEGSSENFGQTDWD